MQPNLIHMDKVLVLMSTYNGEKFLSEQLDSIFSQSGVDVHLLLRDDGSTDTTLDIIDHYMLSYPRHIDFIKGDNIGWRKSFLMLANEAKRNYPSFKYFAFADQDDIWLPEKLTSGIHALESLPVGPQLYCSNVTRYKDGMLLGELRSDSAKPSFKGCLIRNYATGCTMVFNRKLLELVCLEMPQIKVAHDYWFYMVACLCGSVTIDDNSFILYRIHDNNQVGFKSGFREIWKRRIMSVLNLMNSHEKETTAKELLRIHGSSIHKNARDSVVGLSDYRSSFFKRFRLLMDNGYTYNKPSNDFWLKLKIILGRL